MKAEFTIKNPKIQTIIIAAKRGKNPVYCTSKLEKLNFQINKFKTNTAKKMDFYLKPLVKLGCRNYISRFFV